MADHLRQQIREAAATLIGGMTTTGSNIFTSRALPLTNASLPAWFVDTGTEVIEQDEGGETLDGIQRRVMELIFAGVDRDTSGSGSTSTLDTMVKELEAKIETDRKLGGILKDSQLVSMDPDIEEIKDQVFAVITVVYTVTYYTARGAADVAL